MTEPTSGKSFSKWLPWIVILILVSAGAVLWQPISILFQEPDPVQLRADVDRLGILAPLGFFALTIIQIVGAPIPGYPVQLLGGALFGTWIGGIYNVIGLTAGGLISTWLSRTLGQSFIEKQIGAETLTKYETLARLETLWMWVIILSIPLGDFPYYIAGLSRVRFRTMAWAILISRAPFTFVISWAGAASLRAPAWIFWAMVVVILALVAIGYLSKNKLILWLDRHILHRLQ